MDRSRAETGSSFAAAEPARWSTCETRTSKERLPLAITPTPGNTIGRIGVRWDEPASRCGGARQPPRLSVVRGSRRRESRGAHPAAAALTRPNTTFPGHAGAKYGRTGKAFTRSDEQEPAAVTRGGACNDGDASDP